MYPHAYLSTTRIHMGSGGTVPCILNLDTNGHYHTMTALLHEEGCIVPRTVLDDVENNPCPCGIRIYIPRPSDT
jgi:hypothetical protein